MEKKFIMNKNKKLFIFKVKLKNNMNQINNEINKILVKFIYYLKIFFSRIKS